MRNRLIHIPECTAIVLVVVLASCTGLKVGSLPSEADDGSAGDRIQAQLQKAEIPVAVPLVEEWTYNPGGAFGPGSPVLFEDYVATGSRNGDVHVISLESGKKVGSHNYGEAINGAPVRYDNLLIVPVSWGTRKSVVAHNMENGASAWTLRVPPVDVDMLLVDDVLYFVDRSSAVRAVDPVTGDELWVSEFDTTVPIKSAPIELSPGLIAIADGEGVVSAIDKRSGKTEWATNLGEPVFSRMVTDGDLLYCSTTRGTIHAVNILNGRIEWSTDLAADDVRVTSASLFEHYLAIGTSSGWVAVLDRRTADVVWETQVVEAVASTPLITKDYIFVSTMDRLVRALDRDSGEEVWSMELKGRAKSDMVARDNQLIVLSEPRLVYRLVSESEEVAHAN